MPINKTMEWKFGDPDNNIVPGITHPRDDFKLGWNYRNFLDKLGNPFTKPLGH